MKIVITGVILYCLYAALLFFSQRKLIFPGVQIEPPSTSRDSGFQQIWFKTEYGKVEGWFFAANNLSVIDPGPAVLYAHGNYEIIDYNIRLAHEYNKLGVSVLLVEFPGYGRSAGQPSQKSLISVFCKAYDWLSKQSEVDPDRIFAHGRSVGGGPVCALATERNLAALILQSTFTSIKKFAHQFLLPEFLVKDPFDNLLAISNFKNPLLILHGRYDEVIPYANSVELNQTSTTAKFITYDCGHNDFPPDWEQYWKDMDSFLKDNKIVVKSED